MLRGQLVGKLRGNRHQILETLRQAKPRGLRRALSRILPLKNTGTTTHKLSFLTKNEGLPGRWFPEFRSERAFRDRENRRWASWDNRSSFWIQREYLLQGIRDAGFDLVCEQFDSLGADIAAEMTKGSYRTSGRSPFIGVKTAYASDMADPRLSGSARGLRRE